MAHLDKNAEAYYVGLMNASGYRNKDLKKPIIGVVNSWNDVNPGHKPLRELAQYVKEGIWGGRRNPGGILRPGSLRRSGTAAGDAVHPSRTGI